MQFSDDEIKKMIKNNDSNIFKGRFTRLKFLLKNFTDEPFLVSGLASEYYEESRLCWYAGSFVATIIMVQLAFEELFRAHYRNMGINPKLSSGKRLSQMNFSELIDEAKKDKYISNQEASNLHKLRKIRNPYVHSQDRQYKKNGTKPSNDFITQQFKIINSQLSPNVQDEAKFAVQMLKNFKNICMQSCGL